MVLTSAVIGAGVVSGVHLRGLQKCPTTDLVAVCDLDKTRANASAKKYGITPYSDLDQLFANEDLDWVHVCTPVQTHESVAITALEHGVPVLIEKPVTETVEELDAIQRASEKYGVPASVVHNHIFDPAMRQAMRMVNMGKLGRVRGVDLLYTGSTEPDMPNRGAWTFELAGGEFEEGLPHPLYLGLHAGGYPTSIDRVRATATLVGEYELDFDYDCAQVQYVSTNGALCTIKMLSGTIPYRALHIHGEKMSLVVDFISQTVVPLDKNYKSSSITRAQNNLDQAFARLGGTVSNVKAVVGRKYDASWARERELNSHYYQFDVTAQALLNETAMPVSLEAGRWNIQLMELIREAATAERELVKAAIQ